MAKLGCLYTLVSVGQLIIPDEVLSDPQNYRRIGERLSERLDVVPDRYSHLRITRPTYVKKNASIPSIHTAPMKFVPPLSSKSACPPSLLAQVVTAKYCDYLPPGINYAGRFDINISRNTLSHWMEVGADRLQSLRNLLKADLRDAS